MKEFPAPTRNLGVLGLPRSIMLAGLGGLVAILFASQRHGSAPSIAIDRIEVDKSARILSTFRSGKLVKQYRIALGQNPVGAKEQEGDMKTPEGTYSIDGRNAASDFHRALHISYPSPADRVRAAARGVDPGCDLEIHGLPNGLESSDFQPGTDWTAGCIAVTNEEIEELWRITPEGTIVDIRP
jgi:murein L,D-transpeptidase YafK